MTYGVHSFEWGTIHNGTPPRTWPIAHPKTGQMGRWGDGASQVHYPVGVDEVVATSGVHRTHALCLSRRSPRVASAAVQVQRDVSVHPRVEPSWDLSLGPDTSPRCGATPTLVEVGYGGVALRC